MGYNWAIISILIIIVFIFCFIYFKFLDQKLLFKIRKVRYLIIISLFTCIVLPSFFVVLDPIFQEPKIIISATEPEIMIVKAGDSVDATILVNNARGHAWDFHLTSNHLENFFIYIDGVENGEKKINYLSSNVQVEFPFKVDSSYLLANGTYRLELYYEYKNAHNVKTSSIKIIPIYVGYVAIARVRIIVAVLALYVLRKRRLI